MTHMSNSFLVDYTSKTFVNIFDVNLLHKCFCNKLIYRYSIINSTISLFYDEK